jgi:hypothetical protein
MSGQLIEEVPADIIPSVLPVETEEDTPVQANEGSTLGLVELLLKSPARLDARMNHDERQAPASIPRFLGIALASYLLFTLAMLGTLNLSPAAAYPAEPWLPMPAASWHDFSGLALVLAYCIGMVAATCICLPSFYFFGLLAGVRLTMLQIVGQVLRCKASSAIILIGILPVYFAVALGMIVFQAPVAMLECWLYAGLALPFVAGLEGVHAIYRGVLGMAETLPPERRCRRECFLRRLTLSWAACYTAVCPVLIYRLWQLLAG